MRVAINGFGRMGKLLARLILKNNDINLVYINEPNGNTESISHLLEFDSIHGQFKGNNIYSLKNNIHVNDDVIKHYQYSDLESMPVNDIDVLIDCSGLYRKSGLFTNLFSKGLKKVLVSCPVHDDEALNIVYGVNHDMYCPEKNNVITAASCTTNCLAPVLMVLKNTFGIKHGSMTTIHNITNTQVIADKPHKDLRRARACGESLIPTSSGSTSAIMKIFPELNGKLNGLAVRVPILRGSLVDLALELERPTSVEEIHNSFESAKNDYLQGILDIEYRPLVSVDYVGNKNSAIIDAQSTQVIDGSHIKLLAWYDNEINYVSRMHDILMQISKYQ